MRGRSRNYRRKPESENVKIESRAIKRTTKKKRELKGTIYKGESNVE
jgi:hypothetical protein